MSNYYSELELKDLGIGFLGTNVKISKSASLYDYELLSIDDNSRIDDFCVISGKVSIGKNVHITAMNLIAGGEKGVYFSDYSTVAYNCHIFSQSDDYSGTSLTNSTIPSIYKKEKKAAVLIKKFVIVGVNSTILPGVSVEEGCAIGAKSLITKSTKPWGIYYGSPAILVKKRSKEMLLKFSKYIDEKLQ